MSIERWLEVIPKQELNQPVMEVEGRRLTPIEILSEVKSGTELGKKAQAKLQVMGLGTDEDLLKERLKSRLSRYPQNKPLFITVYGELTPRQLLSEVESGTKKGKEFLETESKYLNYIGNLAKVS